MRRLVKYLLIAAAVLVVAVLVGVWLLNRWVQSPETHAYLERELSKQLKLPVKFTTLNFSLWSGLKAKGVRVPDRQGNFLVADELTASHRFGPLLRGQIALNDISLDGAKFTWLQRPDGSWKLPELPEDLRSELEAKKKAKPAAEKTDKAAEAAPKKKKEPDVLIGKIVLTNASADFLDSAGKPFASATGMRMTLLCSPAEEKLEGPLVIGRAVLHGSFAVTEISAGVHQSEEKGLHIQDFKGKVGGGKLTGSYMRKPGKEGSTFSTRMTFSDVDLVSAALDGDAPPPNLSGRLTAELFFRGVNDDWKGESAKGDGKISLQNGGLRKITEIEWLKEVGEFLQFDPATVFTVPDAKFAAKIQYGGIFIEELKLAAPPFMITAKGRAKWDGKMELDARFRADAAFIAKRKLIEPQFQAVEPDGMRSVAFSLKGTVGKPRHDLKEKLTGTKDRKLQDAIAIEAAVDAFADQLPLAKKEDKNDGDEPKKPKKSKAPPPPEPDEP